MCEPDYHHCAARAGEWKHDVFDDGQLRMFEMQMNAGADKQGITNEPFCLLQQLVETRRRFVPKANTPYDHDACQLGQPAKPGRSVGEKSRRSLRVLVSRANCQEKRREDGVLRTDVHVSAEVLFVGGAREGAGVVGDWAWKG